MSQPPQFPGYDEQALAYLEGEARSAAFGLGKATAPVLEALTAELESFDILTATRADCERQTQTENLLATMQNYCETTAAYTEQLAANLAAMQQAAQAEATRAAFAMKQMQMIHQDLMREKKMTDRWWEALSAGQAFRRKEAGNE